MNTLGLVNDLETLGSRLGIPNRNMFHAWIYRNSLQQKIRIGKRIVYKSSSSLLSIQKKLAKAFTQMMDAAEGQEAALAYRKGVHVADVLRGCVGSEILIKTDICKYYDNISYTKIVNTLRRHGINEEGAKKIARFCCVTTRNNDGKLYSSLQQGSPASCPMANLVGNLYFDIPILEWLQENVPPETGYKYYRYSDNMVLFLESEPEDRTLIKRYKSFVKRIARGGGFSTHSWSTTRNKSSKRRQEFLGIVLNEIANISRDKRDWIRSVLFNAVTRNSVAEARSFLERMGLLESGMSDDAVMQRFKMCARGYVSYAKSINPKFGERVGKLCKVAELKIDCGKIFDRSKGLTDINRYKRDAETVSDYVEAVKHLFK